MILNIFVLVMILLITAYLANQGLLSSLLALATAIFSSLLAMALMEPLQGIIGGFKPDYARGITFLVLFFLAFSATRILADIAVPKTIKLSLLFNRIGGGLAGFFTALVVVGSLLIGIEMLPLPNSIMGYNRFPGDTAMQGETPGEVTKQNGIWFNPDRFVLAVWNGASGRALGGNKPWDSVHPDLSVESYGYRNIVHEGSERVIAPDLVKVSEIWFTDDAKEIQQRNITADPGKRVVMVRTTISKGDKPPHYSVDTDERFRISASQIRMVTDKNRQYYPIGILDKGKQFLKLTLETGRVVDDFVAAKKGGDPVATQDWVFQVDADEKPSLVEVKQLAREYVADKLKDKPSPALAAGDYPQHPWLAELCSVTVTFTPKKDSTFKAGHLYILKPEAVRKDVSSILDPAYESVVKISQNMEADANGWSKAGKPGVPSYNDLAAPYGYGKSFKNDPDTTGVNWSQMLQLLLAGQITPSPDRNLAELPRYMDEDVTKIWHGIKGDIVTNSAAADVESGKVTVERLPKGPQTIVFTMLTDKGFFVWVLEKDLAKSSHLAVKASVDGGGADSPIFKIDTAP